MGSPILQVDSLPTEINHGGNIYNMKISKPYKLSFSPWRAGCQPLSPALGTPQAHTQNKEDGQAVPRLPENMAAFGSRNTCQFYALVGFLFPLPSLHTGPLCWHTGRAAVPFLLAELLSSLSKRFAEPFLCPALIKVDL